MTKPIINEKGREALQDYKYTSALKSWLDEKIMTPFWEAVVLLVPVTVAPNVLTFIATLTFMWAYVWFQYYNPDMATCCPSWVYNQLGISLFIYQTLDAIDGKQARRTSSSSPLGQLFDHGNDAFAFTQMLVAGMGTLRYGTSWSSHLVMMCGYIVFYMVNWRARHEGVMHFGALSVTEAQYVAIFGWLITAIFGCEMWQVNILGVSLRGVLTVLLAIGAVNNSISDFHAVQKLYGRKEAKKEDPGSKYELLHMTLFVLSFTCWNLVGTFSSHPRLFIWVENFVFSGLIHRLIVADVTRMKTKIFHKLLLLLPFVALFSIIEYLWNVRLFFNISMNTPLVAYGLLLYVAGCWFIYVSRVINEICETLHIRLFVLTPEQIKKAKENAKK